MDSRDFEILSSEEVEELKKVIYFRIYLAVMLRDHLDA